MDNLTKFIMWQSESPSTRYVDISIQPHLGLKIYVSDFSIPHSGHFVTCVEDIDPIGTATLYDKAELERIQGKYITNN